MTEIVLGLCGFLIFIVLRSLAINGVHELFKGGCIEEYQKGRKCSGNLFYMIAPDFFEKNKNKRWSNPLWSCVKCMGSVWGAITYFPIVIYFFGFEWIEIPIWIFDSFALVYLNYFFYKRQ